MHDSIACEERERDLLTKICELGVAVKEGLEVKAELMKCRKVIEELRSKKDTKNDEFIAVLNTLKVPGFKEPVMGALMAHNESLAAQLESSTKEIYELKESLIRFRKGNLSPELLPLGQPHNLTESEFVNNIPNLHTINNRNMHSAQRKIAQSQSQ